MKDIIKLIIYKFFTLLPIKKNKIICNNFLYKGYGDNPKHIVNELLKRNNDYEIVWLCEKNYNSSLPKGVRPANKTLKYLYDFATSKIWISNVRLPLFLKKRKNQVYIQTWHGGIGLKNVEKAVIQSLDKKYIKMAKADSKKADFFISNSKFLSDVYYKDFWYEGPILKKGLPRNDFLVNGDFSKKREIEEKYNLKGFKVLLYAPTFRKVNSSDVYNIDTERIIKLLEKRTKDKWKIMVKFHPNVKSTEYIKYNEKVIDCSDYSDLNELFLVTDILVTDYSSCMFDYFLLNKPVLIYANDIESYKKDRDFVLALEDTPFSISTTNDELLKNLEKCLDEDIKDSYKWFKEKHQLTETGKASSEVCNIIDRVMEEKVKFSIIIPVYNVEKYIEKCLKSIQEQTYENFEVIIVNDGSPDNSQEIIDNYVKKDSRFKSFIKENGGLSDARNYGVTKVSGDYIIFVDSDDYLENELLERINNKIRNDYYEIVRFNLNLIDDNYRLIAKNSDIKSIWNKKKSILKNPYVEPAWLYAYRTDFFKKNNFIYPKGKIHEDFNLTLLILDKAKKIGIINYCGYNYVQRENSIMHNKDYTKIKKRVADFLEHNKFHKENIKNKYILGYSNKATLFKVSELKDEELEKTIEDIMINKKDYKLRALNLKEFIFNIYFSKFYVDIIKKKSAEFHKEEKI